MQITTHTSDIPNHVLIEEYIPYRTLRKPLSVKLPSRNTDIFIHYFDKGCPTDCKSVGDKLPIGIMSGKR